VPRRNRCLFHTFLEKNRHRRESKQFLAEYVLASRQLGEGNSGCTSLDALTSIKIAIHQPPPIHNILPSTPTCFKTHMAVITRTAFVLAPIYCQFLIQLLRLLVNSTVNPEKSAIRFHGFWIRLVESSFLDERVRARLQTHKPAAAVSS
jgi:hypothetical protein